LLKTIQYKIIYTEEGLKNIEKYKQQKELKVQKNLMKRKI